MQEVSISARLTVDTRPSSEPDSIHAPDVDAARCISAFCNVKTSIGKSSNDSMGYPDDDNDDLCIASTATSRVAWRALFLSSVDSNAQLGKSSTAFPPHYAQN